MPKTLAAVLLLAILALAAWLAVASDGMPEAMPASGPSTDFSADRAMEHVHALASGPRPVGTDAHRRALAYVVAQLRELGLQPQVQETVAESSPRWGQSFGRVSNVVARLPGLEDDPDAPVVLLMAHYDSAQSGPGASDDAVGTAVLLETLRALREAQVPRHDVIALFTDAEEVGLMGAMAFAEDHPWAERVGVVLNFEARGTRGPALMFETGADNAWLIDVFAEAVPNPVAASYSYEVYRRLPNDTDYSVFRRRGLPGLNFAHIHGAVGYHTAEDSIERLDPASLQHHGESALALARALGDTDLPSPDAVPAGDAVYFNPLGSAFVHFPASWVPALAIVLALAALALLVLAIVRRRLGAGGMIGGFFSWLAIAAVSAGLGMVLVRILFPIFYDFRIWGDGSSLAWILFGWFLLVAAVATGLYLLLRRWVSALSMAGGGLLLWTLAAVAVSFVAPGASYLFLVPLAFQLLAAAVLFLTAPARGSEGDPIAGSTVPIAPWLLLALAGVVTALVWASTLALVAVGLQYGAVVIVAALTALLLALSSPQVEVAVRGFPGSGLPVVAVLLIAGIAWIAAARSASGFGPDSPRPTSLFYALDADADDAVWGSFERRVGPWTGSMVPEGSERAPLPAFLGSGAEVAQATAPVLDLQAPRIEVVEPGEDAEAGNGTYRVRVVPPPDAARLRLILSPASALRAVRVDGREVREVGGHDGRLAFSYFAPSPEGVRVEVETEPGAEAPELAAVAQWLRLPGEAQGGPPPRGEESMPTSLTLDTDLTMVRTAVRLDRVAAEEESGEPAEAAGPGEPEGDGPPGVSSPSGIR
jgi:hypothetical protein